MVSALGGGLLTDLENLRDLLLDFVADAAAWEASTNKAFLQTARNLTQAAHEALGGAPGTRPLVVDPFAGGGSIPLEALRIGADAFASDLNPVAVLLNKVVLEYIPKYGQRLADEVCKRGKWLKDQAEEELAQLYPPDPDGAIPIAYLWTRTMRCEGPGCGAEVPLLNRLEVTKRQQPPIVAYVETAEDDSIDIGLREKKRGENVGSGTVKNGTVTCPRCGWTTSARRYREIARDGGLRERMYGVVLSDTSGGGRRYRNATERDRSAYSRAKERLASLRPNWSPAQSTVPNEALSQDEPRRLNVRQYGYLTWDSLFNDRQALALCVLGDKVRDVYQQTIAETGDESLAVAVASTIGLSISNTLHYLTNMSTFLSEGMISVFIQSSAIPMRADYAEANPMMPDLVGGLEYQLTKTVNTLRHTALGIEQSGVVQQSSAQTLSLPDQSADAIVTDPPYYFSIPYADLSDIFYVWQKRFLAFLGLPYFGFDVTPKDEEATQSLPHSQSPSRKNKEHYEAAIRDSFIRVRKSLKKGGVCVVVFAHASTEGWEAIIQGLIGAGWTITATWPIETENPHRMLASRQRTLASSVHLVCRLRDGEGPGKATSAVGDWRDVLAELPKRIREWMPRLAEEGVVGADAIFACLGPALEIFSRYSRVEKASGEQVPLREYLEHVWGAVSQEALRMVFEGADATGFEEDARLTAMWLWTLKAGPNGSGKDEDPEAVSSGGYVLEYDAARKIAQGLGAHLEKLPHVVEIVKDKARLLPVEERGGHLFGKPEASVPKRRKKKRQRSLFEELDEAEAAEGGWGEGGAPTVGQTTLDRVHQTMLLFASGRSAALKRFLVEEGIGRDSRFWTLAQALSALYPSNTQEKRWVDGVLARKKGLGF